MHDFFHAEGGFISLPNILCIKCLLTCIWFVENEIKYIEGYIFLESFDYMYVLKSKIKYRYDLSLKWGFFCPPPQRRAGT